jgi:hypothetical protein
MEHEVGELLADKAEKAAELSKLLTSGTWTHDYPITFDRARELGLPVRNDMPENVLHLMQLYRSRPADSRPSSICRFVTLRVALARKRAIEQVAQPAPVPIRRVNIGITIR